MLLTLMKNIIRFSTTCYRLISNAVGLLVVVICSLTLSFCIFVGVPIEAERYKVLHSPVARVINLQQGDSIPDKAQRKFIEMKYDADMQRSLTEACDEQNKLQQFAGPQHFVNIALRQTDGQQKSYARSCFELKHWEHHHNNWAHN